jgi:tyrosinase
MSRKSTDQPRVRRSLQELQDEYARGNKKPLEDLVRAWKGIQELPPDDPQSFFMLGGYHGEPFRGAGWGDPYYWGGYCNHGNILFPVWHRVFILKLEEALRGIPGCEDVTLPYWDETSEKSQKHGIPWVLTQQKFVLDGVEIDNPLVSFTLNRAITDFINPDNSTYSKPEGYKTVRYPLSGLVGNEIDKAATLKHNALFLDYDKNVESLNQNIVNWLSAKQMLVDGQPINNNVVQQYKDCLNAPNYTVFSNTSSAGQWNNDHNDGTKPVVPLESPHNHIHLAVGGYDIPTNLDPQVGPGDFDQIPGANGDMGENDTAALDPIFYFHHCFVDRVFWLWQKKQGFTDHLEIITEYPGTNTVDSQGPTPGMAPNSWLTLESPLNPFKKKENGKERPYTSLDCINIEKQLGYTYGPGSLEEPAVETAAQPGQSTKVARVSGINRAPIRGSFLVSVYVIIDGKKHLVGTEAVLSRWTVKYCANCQTHLEVKAFIPLHGFQESSLENAQYEVEIRTRDGVLTPAMHRALTGTHKNLFRLEVR